MSLPFMNPILWLAKGQGKVVNMMRWEELLYLYNFLSAKMDVRRDLKEAYKMRGT